MDVQSGSDQPAKADEAAAKKDTGAAAAVTKSVSQTWQRRQQLQAEHDLEGCYTATPLPALPTILRSSSRQRSRWQQMPQRQQEKQQAQLQQQQRGGPQLRTFLQGLYRRLCLVSYTATIRPFSDPSYCGTGFLQATLALLLPVALVPLGVALQLQGTPGLKAANEALEPWAGLLYIAAAVPLLRLLAGPAAAVLFKASEVLILSWPLFSKVPGLDRVRQLHRFAWLLTNLALLAWHAVVFQVLLQQPQQRWVGSLDLDTCKSQAITMQEQHACMHRLVASYSLRVLCCLLLACAVSCVCAFVGIWLLYRALTAHGSDGRECSASPLLLQEVYLSAVCPAATAGGAAAAQQLRQPFLLHNQPMQQQQQHEPVVQRVVLPHRQPAPAAEVHVQMQKQQQQQQQEITVASVGVSTAKAKAAAGATALAAAASLAVLVLAVLVLAGTAAAQPAMAVAAAVAVPASLAAAIAAAAALHAMAAQRTPSAAVTAFGAACCACPAAALACAAALLAAGLGAGGSTQLLAVALDGTAIGALLLALVAALLQLLAAEPHEPWSRQRSQRAKQAATWELLASIMQQYLPNNNSSSSIASLQGCSSSSSWKARYEQAWQQQGTAAWQQLVLKVLPSRDPSTVTGLSLDDIKPLFTDLAGGAAAAADAFSWLDADGDGKVTQADMQAALATQGRSHLGLALTLCSKAELATSVQSVVHVLAQVVLVLLYLAIFEVGTQVWSGAIAALALLLLGCIWVFGDVTRHTISTTIWLLTANPFSIGDTISYNSSDWLVLGISPTTTTLQCLTTNIPHSVPNSALCCSSSIANSSRCSNPTVTVKASMVGVPAAKLGQLLEHVRAAAAAHAAVRPALYKAGSCVVRLLGDRLVCNGSVDFVEAELALVWMSGCPGSDRQRIAEAKAGMLQVVQEQYSCFMAPLDNTRPIPDVNMWSNPVYN